jgi:hypothetical protein
MKVPLERQLSADSHSMVKAALAVRNSEILKQAGLLGTAEALIERANGGPLESRRSSIA